MVERSRQIAYQDAATTCYASGNWIFDLGNPARNTEQFFCTEPNSTDSFFLQAADRNELAREIARWRFDQRQAQQAEVEACEAENDAWALCAIGAGIGFAAFNGPGAVVGCVTTLFLASQSACINRYDAGLTGSGGDEQIPLPTQEDLPPAFSNCLAIANYENDFLTCASPALLEHYQQGKVTGVFLPDFSSDLLIASSAFAEQVYTGVIEQGTSRSMIYQYAASNFSSEANVDNITLGKQIFLPAFHGSAPVLRDLLVVEDAAGKNRLVVLSQVPSDFGTPQGLLHFYALNSEGRMAEQPESQLELSFASCFSPQALLPLQALASQARVAVLCQGQTDTFLEDYEVLLTDQDGSNQVLIDLTDPLKPGLTDFDPVASSAWLQVGKNAVTLGIDGRIMVSPLEVKQSDIPLPNPLVLNSTVIDDFEGEAVQAIGGNRNSDYFFVFLSNGSFWKVLLPLNEQGLADALHADFGRVLPFRLSSKEEALQNVHEIQALEVVEDNRLLLVLSGLNGDEYRVVNLEKIP